MTTKAKLNKASEELENAVIRQADSMGLEPGSDEFELLVMERIIEPERRMLSHLRDNKYPIRVDVMVDSIDNRFVQYRTIKSLLKWCRLNRGMGLTHASYILQIKPVRLHELGEQAVRFGFEDFTEHLDGTDDRVMSSMWPDQLDEGCYRTGTGV